MRFSVILPIYNVENYLYDAIDSVLIQSYSNFEIILVDDGSTDNCPHIVDDFASRDNRIVPIHQKNQGLSSARNSGIKIARGEYIVFLDSDDLMNTDTLKIIDKIIVDHKNPDLIIGNMFSMQDDLVLCVNEFDADLVRKPTLFETIQEFIVRYNWIPWAAYQSVYKRSFLVENEFLYNEEIIGAEDCDFFLKILPKVKTFYVTDNKFVIYRLSRNGSIISHPRKNAIDGQLETFAKIYKTFKNSNDTLLSHYFANKFTNIVILIGYLDLKSAKSCVDFVKKNKDIIAYSELSTKYIVARIIWKLFGIYYGSKILLCIKNLLEDKKK